jgi:hypothetical protein
MTVSLEEMAASWSWPGLTEIAVVPRERHCASRFDREGVLAIELQFVQPIGYGNVSVRALATLAR